MTESLASGGTAEDWQEIRQVLNSYCTSLDRLDFELLRRCFHPGAVTNYGDFITGTIDDFVAYNEGPEGLLAIDRTMHFLGNTLIEVEGDVAHTEAYCIAHHTGPEDHPWCKGFVIVWCRYADRFERRDGAWRIAHRTCVFEWARNESTGEWMPLSEGSLGIRDMTDPRYAGRA
jgi:hypothetical protein